MDDLTFEIAQAREVAAARAPQHPLVGQKRHVVSQGGGDVSRQRTQSASTGSNQQRVPFQALAQSYVPAPPVHLRPAGCLFVLR